MGKEMTLEVLSSIKGAKSSKAVDELFERIKSTNLNENIQQTNQAQSAVNISDLRQDEVIESSELEKQIIRENFPKEKNGYLVVAKVID